MFEEAINAYRKITSVQRGKAQQKSIINNELCPICGCQKIKKYFCDCCFGMCGCVECGHCFCDEYYEKMDRHCCSPRKSND